MRNFIKLAGGTAIVALMSGTAYAADVVETPPEPVEAPYVAPVPGWQGAYVGVFGGYEWGNFDTTGGDLDDANGAMGGGFAGYNMQSGNVVYGLEGDLGFSGAEDSAAGVTAEQGLFGSVRGRVGYAFDPVLIYGTGGLAATRAEVSNGTSSDSNTHLGYTVGAGADVKVTENVFGRLEYRFSDYQEQDYTLDTGTVSSGFDSHSIAAGIGVKF